MNTRIINTPSYPSSGASPDIRHEILTNELGNQMLDMVAPIYDRSKVALHLFQAFGETLEPVVDFIWNDIVAQIHPQTATWGLDYWEEQYGIVTDKSKTIEQRRASFMAMKFNRPPMTPKRIEYMITSLTGLKCEVVENVAPNTFNVTMYGGYPNIKSVFDTLAKKAPAHLIYTIKVVETLETTSETFPVVTGSFGETLGEIGVAAYTREAERMAATTANVFQAMASGNIVERFGEIEVIN